MFRDCLFTVKPALLFDAAKELEKFLKAQQELATGGGPTDPRKDEAAALAEKEARAEREAVLRYAVEKETASNASKKSLHGSRVAYGNSVLLRHVKSRGFLSLVSKSVAELEAACTLVALRPVPSPAALFEVSPRYKLRSHGQVSLRVCVRLIEACVRGACVLHWRYGCWYCCCCCCCCSCCCRCSSSLLCRSVVR